ncbi:unnamed protein product [Rotaria sordida]|uniref:Uncharacterized protein n=1 Tax=Rotaria sordida TaxID=392033 RepID=A0A813Y0X2_9BILA|nr:unnamed protein product [Rotaria sordida]CAF0888670.1 unnamed protein product [Rotaria sordida]CAF1476351.1 unnamed protein product [Rotaria sordida]CAF1646641.1 unnamed protein product [Rotaria sordida]CAF3628144.1 unnamed protein product [Rotaria sordida]
MTNIKSSFVRRTSLCPPHERSDLPNASMVDGSSVPKSITQHPRQRDQETATVQDQQNQLAQQRLSLINAVQIVKNWHKKTPMDNPTNEIHQSDINVHRINNLIKK